METVRIRMGGRPSKVVPIRYHDVAKALDGSETALGPVALYPHAGSVRTAEHPSSEHALLANPEDLRIPTRYASDPGPELSWP